MDATTTAAIPALAAQGPAPSPSPRIARIWHGRTSLARAEEYRQYLFDAGVTKIAAISGNRGVQMMMRETPEEAEFMVVSYWDTIEAVKAFAGAAYEQVRDLPRDDEFLIAKETQVRHFQLEADFRRD